MSETAHSPRRLIICVDGTWCHPDGAAAPGGKANNITNVYRVFASVGEGDSIDKEGKGFIQQKRYYKGIGSEDDLPFSKRIRDGVFGRKCLDQIRTVYRECCRTTGSGDEVWLYGFSRGAYVVRAVAGLLHYIRVLASADEADSIFEEDYKNAIKVYSAMQRQHKLGDGQIHHMLATTTRDAPTIRFVGAFDTVKAVNDDHIFDISLNGSIQNFRHALALNENREAMSPEYDFPQFARNRQLLKQTFVQAWFVGAHIDMGGSSAKDGLSLYPLQWMLLESRKLGLKLGFSGTFGGRSKMENPLQLVRLDTASPPWTCDTENKMPFEMIDIMHLHKDEKYAIHLNRDKGMFWRRKARVPFDQNGQLEGFCSFAPQGTAVHPSVYLLLDWQLGLTLDMETFPVYPHLQRWKYRTLGYQGEIPVQGFWNEFRKQEIDDLGAIRILVCGNAGVGKSSLINRVFGVEKTKSSDRIRGVHDIKEEITWPGRPDLIIHDSEGFEAAGVEEFEVIEEFLREKANELELNKRLHAIWFCLLVNDTRPIQQSTKKLFQIVDRYAQDIPIVVIATKKDEFEAIKEKELRTTYKNQGKQATLEEMDAFAAHELKIRLETIQEEIGAVECGRFDLCVAVSKDDRGSIEDLTKKTSECFSQDTIRLLYIRAQVARLDLKVDLAVAECMRVYRNVLYSSTALAGVPIGNTTNRVSSAINLCKTIVNCFGVPSVNPQTVFEIYKANVVDDVGNCLLTAIAEATAAVTLFLTVGLAGLPVFLVPMVSNIPLVVPTTARLLLMLSCDLILIFTRAFRDASAQCKNLPDLECVQKAASAYRMHSAGVHARVKQLVPKLAKGAVQCYRTNDIKLGVKDILKDFMSLTTEGIASPATTFRNQANSPRLSVSSSTTAFGSDESIREDRATIEETLQGFRSRQNSNNADSSPQMKEAMKMVKQMGLAN